MSRPAVVPSRGTPAARSEYGASLNLPVTRTSPKSSSPSELPPIENAGASRLRDAHDEARATVGVEVPGDQPRAELAVGGGRAPRGALAERPRAGRGQAVGTPVEDRHVA